MKNVQDNCWIIWRKKAGIEIITLFGSIIEKKIDNEPVDYTLRVCKEFVRQLTGCFFIIRDKQTESNKTKLSLTPQRKMLKRQDIFGQCTLILITIFPILIQ